MATSGSMTHSSGWSRGIGFSSRERQWKYEDFQTFSLFYLLPWHVCQMGYQDIPVGSGDCNNGHWGSEEGCGRSVWSWSRSREEGDDGVGGLSQCCRCGWRIRFGGKEGELDILFLSRKSDYHTQYSKTKQMHLIMFNFQLFLYFYLFIFISIFLI